MTPEVFFLVLLAAFLHALWNALVKVDGDGISSMAVIVAVQAAISLLLITFVPIPGASGWAVSSRGCGAPYWLQAVPRGILQVRGSRSRLSDRPRVLAADRGDPGDGVCWRDD